MAKLIKAKLGITTGGYSFDFVFHRPVTVINGKSAIGKSLFFNKFKTYCAANKIDDFVFINYLTPASSIEALLKLKNKVFIIDNADVLMSLPRDYYENDNSNQYIFLGRLIYHYTLDLVGVATIIEDIPNKRFSLWYPDAGTKVEGNK